MVEQISVVADTSVFIGRENQRFSAGYLDQYLIAVSSVTLGELRLGVLNAGDPDVMSQRLSTYQFAQMFDALPIDERVADAWSELIAQLRKQRRKMPINDSWIAATAKAHNVAVLTQDADFDTVPSIHVVKL